MMRAAHTYYSYIFIAVSLLGATPVTTTPAAASPPELHTDTNLATAGYFRLNWGGNSDNNYILQESSSPEFSDHITLYQGPDTATLVSGRGNGSYFYRIRSMSEAATLETWSNVVKVEVVHHPLSRAFMFFILGAIVFISTLAVVIFGNKTQQR